MAFNKAHLSTALTVWGVLTATLPSLGITILVLFGIGWVIVSLYATLRSAYSRPLVVRLPPKTVEAPAAQPPAPAAEEVPAAERAAELRRAYRRNIDIIRAMPLPKHEKRALREEARERLMEQLAEVLR